MRKTALMLATLATTCGAFAMPALADDDRRCAYQPRERWMPIEQANARAQALGYTAHEIEADDGCWEIAGVDRNGVRVKLKLDPVTGEIVPRRR